MAVNHKPFQNHKILFKISITGILLALAAVIYLLQIPTFFAVFLSFDFSLIIVALATRFLSLWQGLLIAVVAPWFGMVLTGNIWIGSLMNSLLGIVICLCIYASWRSMALTNNNPQANKLTKPNFLLLLKYSCIVIVTALITAFWAVFLNWAFILDLYPASQYKKPAILFSLFFPFTLLKVGVNLIIFFIIEKIINVNFKNKKVK